MALFLLMGMGAAHAAERCNLGREVPVQIQVPGIAVIVFTDSQCFGIYENGRIANRFGYHLFGYASTGGPGNETPLTDPQKGPQRVNRASEFHESTEFPIVVKGKSVPAPMPYALFFDLNGRAIHAANVLQPLASHGCIRLPKAAAYALFHGFNHAEIQIIVTHDPDSFSILWERGHFADRAFSVKEEMRQANTGRSGEIDSDMFWHEEPE
ncbi:MAG: L,D-transpeptidase [Minisyncoccia bacterium]